MATRNLPRGHIDVIYTRYAREYLASLPLEHFMESTAQSTQRKITDASLALVQVQRSDLHVFGELLVQYPIRGRERPGQIVPDNMVVIHDGPIEADTNYAIPIQPAGLFWVLEYVSKGSERKDYGSSLEVYERGLKVPYYLVFYPDNEELTLFRLTTRRRYRTIVPDANGRCPIPELDLQVGLIDNWVRYWYQGELLPLPGELLRQLTATQERLTRAEQRLTSTEQRLTAAEDELARERQAREALEAELARLRGQQK